MKRLRLTDNAIDVLNELNRPGVAKDRVRAIGRVFDGLENDEPSPDIQTEPVNLDGVSRSLADPGPPPWWVYWREGPDDGLRTVLDIIPG